MRLIKVLLFTLCTSLSPHSGAVVSDNAYVRWAHQITMGFDTGYLTKSLENFIHFEGGIAYDAPRSDLKTLKEKIKKTDLLSEGMPLEQALEKLATKVKLVVYLS